MDGECVYGEFLVHGAESVNIIDHCQEEGWCEGGMPSKAMEIVSDRDARGGSAGEYRVRHARTNKRTPNRVRHASLPRVKPRQTTA